MLSSTHQHNPTTENLQPAPIPNTTDRSRSRSTSSVSSSSAHGANGERQSRSRNRQQADENHGGRDLNGVQSDVEPLLNTDVEMIPTIVPPIAPRRRSLYPETDDDDRDERLVPNTPEAHPGVDGGFFTGEDDDDSATTHPDTIDGGVGKRREPDFGPRLGEDDEGATEMDRRSPRQPGGGGVGGGPRGPSFPGPTDFEQGFNGVGPDVNVYQQKKTLAQGMMDLALLSANANQLRYVLESYDNHPYYHVSLVFIAMSILLQIGVGVGLIWNSRYNVKNYTDICKADKINNFTVMGIFMITTVNVFITSFGVAQRETNGSSNRTA